MQITHYSYEVLIMVAGLVLSFTEAHSQTFTPSDIGKPAPDFELYDTYDQAHSLRQYQGSYIVLEWLNFKCVAVDKHYRSGLLPGLQKKLVGKEVVWLSIISSSPTREGQVSNKQVNRQIEKRKGQQSAVLMDHEGFVGQMYGVEVTPHLLVIDPTGVLIYEGALDNQPAMETGDNEQAINYVEQALQESMNGDEVAIPLTKAYGCEVKYERP